MERRRLNRRDFLKGVSLSGMSLALAACGGAGAPSAGNQPAGEQGASAPGSTTTRTILFWYNAENHKAEYEARVAELNKKFNIDFKMELIGGDAQGKKLQATLMAGSGFPDIAEMNAIDVVKFLKGDDAAIPFVALNDVLQKGPYFSEVLKSRWDRYTKSDMIYGAPHDVHPIVLLYNDVAWQEFGVDLSKINTWDELLEASAKVDPKMPDGSPRYALMDSISDTAVAPRMLQKGIWWTDANGEPMLTDPRFKEAVADALRFKQYRADIDWANQVAMLKSGQALAEPTPDWLFGIHKQGTAEDTELLANSPMRITKLPGFTADGVRTGTWGGTAGTIPKMSPNKDLATEILLYMYYDNAEKQLVKRFTSTGILPPVKSVWADQGFHQEDPYVGGQKSGEIFIEAAENLPSYSENAATVLVSSAWGTQALLLWTDQIGIDEAIAAADTAAREQIEKNL
jgi:arabinosaccharide transport system substrate-binding protein